MLASPIERASRPRPPSNRSLSSSTSSTPGPVTPSLVDQPPFFNDKLVTTMAATIGEYAPTHHARSSSDLSNSFASTGRPVVSERKWGGKSREELEHMLLQADELITRKEKELAVAASLGQSLLEHNNVLRGKHDNLAARLGNDKLSAPSLTFSPSIASFVQGLGDGETSAPTSPRKRFSARMTFRDVGEVEEPTKGDRFTQPTQRRRTRTQSARSSYIGTPVQETRQAVPASPYLATLDARNVELSSQLEDLQAETARADRVGKQKLRKLDKELAGLREELDRALNNNQELEQKLAASASLAHHAAVAQAKVASVARSDDDEESVAGEFAWPAQLTSVAPMARRRRVSTDVSSSSPASTPTLVHIDLPPLDDETSQAPSEAITPELSRNGNTETLIVAQLLAKIDELESTNDSISAHREELDERLGRAQVELDGLRRSYEELESDLRQQEERNRPLEIGWHDQTQAEPESPTYRRAIGNKRLIEQRKKSYTSLRQSPEKSRAASKFRGPSLRMTSSTSTIHRKASKQTLRKVSSRSAFFGGGEELATAEDNEDIVEAIRREDRERLLVPDDTSRAPSRLSSPGPGHHTLGSELGSQWGHSPPPSPTKWDDGGRYSASGESEDEDEADHRALQPPRAARPSGLPGRSPPRPDHRYYIHGGYGDEDDVFGPEAVLIPLGGLRDTARPDEDAYDSLDKAASEMPIAWSDEAPAQGRIGWQRGPTFNGGFSYEDASGDESGNDVWNENAAAQKIESAEMVAERERQERREMRRREKLRKVAESETASTITTGSKERDYDPNALKRRAKALRRLGQASRVYDERERSGSDEFEEVEGPRRRTGRGRDYWPVAFRARYAPGMVANRMATRVQGHLEQLIAYFHLFAVVALAVVYAISQGPTAVLGQGQRRLRRED